MSVVAAKAGTHNHRPWLVRSNRPQRKIERSPGAGPCFRRGDVVIGVPAKNGYASPVPSALIEDLPLIPDNDASPAPFGAFTPNAAQAAIIGLAQRTRLK